MSATTPGKFSCEACNKSYTWKAELAGKRVKCKCGQPLTVPATDPAAAMYEAPPEGFEDLYAFAEQQAVQAAPEYAKAEPVSVPAGGKARGKSRPAAAVATAPPLPAAAPARKSGGGNSVLAGYAQMSSKRGGRAEPAAGARAENVYWNPVTDLYVPAGLILLGMFLSFFEIRVVYGLQSTPIAIGAVFVLTIVNVVLGFTGILIATKLLDLGLGPVPVALLKTAAAAILPAAAASLIGSMIPFGGILAWFISFGLSLIIFMKLMDMDYFETAICTAIIWLVRTWVGYAILHAIFSGMAGGGGGGALIAAAGGASAVAAAAGEGEGAEVEEKPAPGAKYDKRAQSLLRADRKPDAKKWASEPGRWFTDRTPEQTVKIIDDLAAMGATFMVVPDPAQPRGKNGKVIPNTGSVMKEVANSLVFVLPETQEQRQQIFSYYHTLGKVYPKNLKDEGQTYMSIHFTRTYFWDEDEDEKETDNTPDLDDDE